MCGITGITTSNLAKDDLQERIIIMTNELKHRGPDALNTFVQDGVALGHTRLSIIDLTHTGNQPMTDSSKQVTVVLNGEVYNYKVLKRELLNSGLSFQGTSDTEVLLQAYMHWGLQGLKRLEGIFSFAIWDSRSKSLVLARDRLGIKPLFFSNQGGNLYFASEIKSLLKNSEISKELNSQSFSEYLWYGNTYEDRTMFKDIFSLKPGHWLIQKDNKIDLIPWWSLEEFSEREKFRGSFEDAVSAVRSAIDDSVRRQLVADVPISLFLSGGLDSSAIAASAVKDGPLTSFSCGFDFESGIKELPKAKIVADHLGLNHHEIQISGHDIQDCILKLVEMHDEPFADAANIPLYLMSEKLKGSHKVVLQGDGGDEVFGGYRRYKLLRNNFFWQLFPKWIGKNLSSFGDLGNRTGRILNVMGNKDMSMKMAMLLTLETQNNSPFGYLKTEKSNFISENTDPFLAYKSASLRFKDYDKVDQMLLTDLSLQLPSQFLSKVDRATMSQGIEARVPLLDENLLSLSLSLPSKFKVSLLQDKRILRKSIENRLPAEIVNQKKTGFGVPYQYWIKNSLYDLVSSSILDKGFCDDYGFDKQKLERTLISHRDNKTEAGFTLWKIFQFALWTKTIQ